MNTKMAGTQNTFKYIVVAENHNGRLGFRPIGSGEYRVRLEPVDAEFARLYSMKKKIEDWGKQPMDDDQLRFSTVVPGGLVRKAISEGIAALNGEVEVNPEAPEWARDLVKNPTFGASTPPSALEEEPESEDEDEVEDEAPQKITPSDLKKITDAIKALADAVATLK